jgi:hypothetical protein
MLLARDRVNNVKAVDFDPSGTGPEVFIAFIGQCAATDGIAVGE